MTRQASKHLDLTAIRRARPRGLLSAGVGKVPTEIGSLESRKLKPLLMCVQRYDPDTNKDKLSIQAQMNRRTEINK